MVVSDLDLESIAMTPREAYAPLVIDTDAVLAEPLETVAGWLCQVRERTGSVDDEKLSCCGAKDRWRKMPRSLAAEDRLSILVREGLDHRGE